MGGALIVTSGGGSFITYPILLAVGETSIVANATSSVGLFAGWTVSLPHFRKEFKAQKKIILPLLLPAFLGAILGSFLLTKTPDSIFSLVAPLLIFFGSLALQFRHKIVHWGERIHVRTYNRRMFAVGFLTFFVASYSSFFGAGVGIIMLAVLSILGVEHLVHNIAIKNAIVIVANGVAFIYFLQAGIVDVPFAIAIACGSVPGGYAGAKLIHHIPEKKVRTFTVIFGIVASVVLLGIRLSTR